MSEVKQFDQKHGPERYSDGTFYYYADGSLRDVDPLGLMVEPGSYDPRDPEHEHALASNRLRFAQLKLAKAVGEFDDLQERLAHATTGGDAELEKLQRLQREVEERRKLVAQAEEALGSTGWGRQRRLFREAQREEAARVADFQQKRRAIRI